MKEHFFFKLVPPRSTFPGDMSDAEHALMLEHAQYTEARIQAGDALLAGPVFAPDGAFGIAILTVRDLAAAHEFGANDPSVKGGLNTFEIHPMRVIASAKSE